MVKQDECDLLVVGVKVAFCHFYSMTRTSINQKLGRNLAKIRKEKGITQEKLQDLSGLDRGYISGVERGVRNPSVRNIDRLAKALKVQPTDLLS